MKLWVLLYDTEGQILDGKEMPQGGTELEENVFRGSLSEHGVEDGYDKPQRHDRTLDVVHTVGDILSVRVTSRLNFKDKL